MEGRRTGKWGIKMPAEDERESEEKLDRDLREKEL